MRCLLVPNLCANLLSVSRFSDGGNSVIFRGNRSEIFRRQDCLLATASKVEGVYKLDQPAMAHAKLSIACQQKHSLWHRRMGHLSLESLIKLKDMADGVNFRGSESVTPCTVCMKGKQTRLPFKHTGTRATEVLELVHSDVCGPMSVKTI